MRKVAIVTGGARRIGAQVVRRLHHLGFDIALHYRNSAPSAAVVADELNSARAGSCKLFQADLQVQEQLDAMVVQLLAQYQSIDLLVNNASRFEPTPIEDCTTRQFDSMMAANFRGPYFLIQGLLPALQTDGGSVVNILDVHMDRPLSGYNIYGAAKSALASLTRSLAVELAPAVRVNGVAPGAILWPEGDASYDEAMRMETLAKTPLERLGDPQDIAATVAFLACDAPFITGQVIVVDGGRGLAGQ